QHSSVILCVIVVGGMAGVSGVALYSFLRQVRRRELDDERRLRDYAETASDWFWETGTDHSFTYMSDRARAYGIDPNKRIGTSRLAIAIDRNDEPEKWREHSATLERHEPFRDFVYARNVDYGPPRYVSVSGKPRYDECGNFQGYRGTARDV